MLGMWLNKVQAFNNEQAPLQLRKTPAPTPNKKELLIRVHTCGVCHTELDEIEGRTPPPKLPIVLGHQVVGTVVERGEDCHRIALGERVGVAWIFSACGECEYCTSEQENLCSQFQATGRDAHGGYAEYMCAPEAFVYRIPDSIQDAHAAPLLCAGAIGYRSMKLCELEDGQVLGLTGFGASAHLMLPMIRHLFPNIRIQVFARNPEERRFALELGADWAGDTHEQAPETMHAIVDTTPAWKPILEALKQLRPGGRLVINAIRKEGRDNELLKDLDYPSQLWLEKEIKSVANVTRADVEAFLQLAAQIPIQPEVELYSLEQANQALLELKQQHIRGAKVLQIFPTLSQTDDS